MFTNTNLMPAPLTRLFHCAPISLRDKAQSDHLVISKVTSMTRTHLAITYVHVCSINFCPSYH